MTSITSFSEGVASAPSAEAEIWKNIPEYEGRYQASNFGRIKSLGRMVRGKSRKGKWFFRSVPERILRPGKYEKSGHVSVVLERGGNGKPVHQLIAKTFIGEPPSGMEVLHNNGNPTDNRLDNLRYGSRTDNILDVYRQGGQWRKLSVEDVEAIRFALYCGIRGTDLAKEYKVAQSTICSIKYRRIFWWLK